jgi:hypothetical protein
MRKPFAWSVLMSLLVTFGAVAASTRATADETSFRFNSTPGSVGQGFVNYSVTPADGWTFSASASADHSYVRLRTRSLDPNAPLNNYYWDLDLEATTGNVLTPGFYPGATRYPFNAANEPGMWLSGNHLGHNTITGYYTVLEAVFGPGTTVNRFAVDFRQYGNGDPNVWVDGKFRFNATVPEPATFGLLLLAAPAIVVAGRRRSRSHSAISSRSTAP